MDRRERDWSWFRFNEKEMVLILHEGTENEVHIPAKFEVCGTCDGKGTHVNPSIDSHGLSQEDFDEDPDFRESYFSGQYDVPCNECQGRRVTPEPDEVRATPEQLKAWEQACDEAYQEAVERDYAIRMGY